jgi:hypothetical protein
LHIFNTPDEIVTFEVEVDRGTLLVGDCDLTLVVRLNQVGPPFTMGCTLPATEAMHKLPFAPSVQTVALMKATDRGGIIVEEETFR